MENKFFHCLETSCWWRILPVVVLLAAGLMVPQNAMALHACGDGILDYDEVCDDGNNTDGDGCNSICQLEANSCVDDVTNRTNNCTANDVRIALVLNQTDAACELGTTIDLDLIAKLEATSAERWDIGMFVALDGGTARTGTCYQDFLDGVSPPLQPSLPDCEGTCSLSADPCSKDEDCPDFAIGETCAGGYNPGALTQDANGSITFFENGGPFYDGECPEDPDDICGDLEQGVETYYEFPVTLTVPCVDNDLDGRVDIGGCLSWDNGRSAGNANKPSCLTVRDTVPNTKAKCKCENINIGNVYVAGKIIVDKVTIPAGRDEFFDFTLNLGMDTIDTFSLQDGSTPYEKADLDPSFVAGDTYSVTETLPITEDIWDLVNVTCTSSLNGTVDPDAIDLQSGETVTCVFTNELLNQTPVCSAGADFTTDCNVVQLSGATASDPDGDDLTFSWSSDCGATFDDNTLLNPTATFGDGCEDSCTFTLTVTDGELSCESNVFVEVDDDVDPNLTVPDDATVECTESTDPSNTGQATATDNCSEPTVTFTDTPNIDECGLGTIVRTWTAVDFCGNSVSTDQIITIVDTIDPVLSGVPADATLECDQDLPAANVTATDNCDTDPTVTMTTLSDTRGDECGGVGQVVRQWTASDCSGNSVSAQQTVTFGDTTDPVLSGVPADATLECDQVLPPANVTATDNCDTDPTVTMTTLSDTRGDECGGVGQVVRQWTASDCSGNSVSAQQTVTFVDTTDPVLSGVPADATLECDQVLPPANVTATDNCDTDPTVTMTTLSDTRGDECGGVGQVVRQWTASDCSGNSVSAQQTVTFVDTTDPVLSGVPADATLECDQVLPPANVTATDNCDTDPTVTMTTLSDTRGDECGGVGQVVRQWTASDCSGNSVSAQQTVTFVDTTDPVLSGVPADATLECDQVLPPANVTATDNCDTDPTVTMTTLSDTRGDECGGVGQVVRQWTASDCSGNSVSAQQTVTFVDTTDPVLSGVPADATLECDQVLPPANVTATDNCDTDPTVTMTTLSDTRGDECGGVGRVVRQWTASDCSGNSVSAQQTVTFVDTTDPVLSGVPADATLECDQVLPPANVTATDNCDTDPTVTMTTLSDTRGDECSGVGQVVRQWTASDCSGNSVSAQQTVTFVDTTSPALTLPPDVTLDCYPDTSPDNTGFASTIDNCDANPTVGFQDTVIDDDTCGSDFVIQRRWTATDCSGNPSTGIQTITVDCPCGTVELTKYTNGVLNDGGPGSMPWSFTLSGPGIDDPITDSSPPEVVDFGGVALRPTSGTTQNIYTLCETGIFAGWTLAWSGDPNLTATTPGDGIADMLIPQVFMVNTAPVVNPPGYSSIFDPNYVPPPGTFVNDTRCVDFIVLPGETEVFSIDNQFPGGEPRTIGYWKNWNTCSNGNQAQTAADLGGPDAGVYILNDILNDPGITIGLLTLGTGDCDHAVNILDKRDLDGKKKARDAAYNLAAQLLAANANLSTGAETCPEVVLAVMDAQTLLLEIEFDGTGNYLRPKDGQLFRDANTLARTLDEYNNGALCTP